jgi:hypothetical protein
MIHSIVSSTTEEIKMFGTPGGDWELASKDTAQIFEAAPVAGEQVSVLSVKQNRSGFERSEMRGRRQLDDERRENVPSIPPFVVCSIVRACSDDVETVWSPGCDGGNGGYDTSKGLPTWEGARIIEVCELVSSLSSECEYLNETSYHAVRMMWS